MIGWYTIELGDILLLLLTFFIQPFQLACENFSPYLFMIYPEAQMISAGFISAGVGANHAVRHLMVRT